MQRRDRIAGKVGADPPSAHFLNNVLAVAASWIDDDPERARDVLADLGVYLDHRLRTDRRPVPLADELLACAALLRLEAERAPGRVRVHALPTAASATIVPLALLEPLEHAVRRRLETEAVSVTLAVDDEWATATIAEWPGGAHPERVEATLVGSTDAWQAAV